MLPCAQTCQDHLHLSSARWCADPCTRPPRPGLVAHCCHASCGTFDVADAFSRIGGMHVFGRLLFGRMRARSPSSPSTCQSWVSSRPFLQVSCRQRWLGGIRNTPKPGSGAQPGLGELNPSIYLPNYTHRSAYRKMCPPTYLSIYLPHAIYVGKLDCH